MVKLKKYFGKTAQFPLENDRRQKGRHHRLDRAHVAPALALGFGKDTSWRASREKAVREHELAEHTDIDRLGRSVLLPVPRQRG